MQEDKILGPHPDTWHDPKESDTWSNIVASALASLGGTASLASLYATIERHPKTAARKHWKAKVRQVIQTHEAFVRVGEGRWSLASGHTAEEIEQFQSLRRERYPLSEEPKS